jgi:putative oxygen-independent coproporphyrinogen III oxidase
MSHTQKPPLSLYIHFPWCVAKCPYCDFNSHVHRGELPHERYIGRLLEEMQLIARQYDGRALVSIFMGGGTPSLFPPEHIATLLSQIQASWPIAPDAEITLEANPGALEYGSMAGYKHAGITRVSLGAQSFNMNLLKSLGRIHQPEDTRTAVAEIQAAGICDFNLDLMNQLPQQTPVLACDDLQAALALDPTHISLYELTIEPNTVFAAHPPTQPDEAIGEAIYRQAMRLLSAAGYEQYEVSAFAKPGHRCRHNLNYWEFGDYLAIGAGAHGKWTTDAGQILRTENAKLPRDYLNQPWEQIHSQTSIPRDRLPFEFLLNALRLKAGFSVALLSERTGLTLQDLEPGLEQCLARQLLTVSDARVVPTQQGYRYLNEVLTHFLEV